jgi:hypothetical protein
MIAYIPINMWLSLFFTWQITGIPFNVSSDPDLAYNWDIYTCGQKANFTITQNNQTFLTREIDSKYNDYFLYTLPGCAFGQNKCTDKYDWSITSNKCNYTNRTKFHVDPMIKYYATNVLNSYILDLRRYETATVIIEIPHFTDSLKDSCLDMTFMVDDFPGDIHPIEIYDGLMACSPNSYYDNYIKVIFKNDKKKYGYSTANVRIGCTYPDQLGPFDIEPGKKYLAQFINTHRSWDRTYYTKLQINPRDPIIEVSDAYRIWTIILGSSFCLIMVGILLMTCYKKYYSSITSCLGDSNTYVQIDED